MKLTVFAAFMAFYVTGAQAGEVMGQFGNFTVVRTNYACVAETQNDIGDALNIVFAPGRFNLVVYSSDLESAGAEVSEVVVPVSVDAKAWRITGEIDGHRGAVWIGTQNSLSNELRLDLMRAFMNGGQAGFFVMANGEPIYAFSLSGSEAAMRFALNECMPLLMGN